METLATTAFISLILVTSAQLLTIVITARCAIAPRFKNFFMSFAVGALLGNALVHVLPVAFIYNPEPLFISNMLLLGVLINFFTEKFIRVYNFHLNQDAENIQAIQINHFIMDFMHSVIIGSTIVASYQQSNALGAATSLALGLISITQILSTMNIMRHHGISQHESIKSLVITSLGTLIAGGIINFYHLSVEKIDHILLPIGAGMFIYVALRKLIPELHEETNIFNSIVQAIILLAGIYIMYFIPT